MKAPRRRGDGGQERGDRAAAGRRAGGSWRLRRPPLRAVLHVVALIVVVAINAVSVSTSSIDVIGSPGRNTVVNGGSCSLRGTFRDMKVHCDFRPNMGQEPRRTDLSGSSLVSAPKRRSRLRRRGLLGTSSAHARAVAGCASR